MVRVAYPAPIFRPVPPFSIDVPDDWVITEFPGALFVMGPTQPPDGNWSNVVIRHERVLPDADFKTLAKATWAELKVSYPDARLVQERLIHAEHLHYVREGAIVMEGVDVTRFDTMVFGPDTDHPTVDLFQMIWMHPAADGEARTELYMHMLRSFRFTG